VRRVVLLLALIALTACGSAKKPDLYKQANLNLLNRIPVYPNAASPKTSTSGASNTEFGARDWTLPTDAKASVVIAWYAKALETRGWKVVDRNGDSLRLARHGASLTFGVRGRTLEAVANSRGG
jgi:hypothetical protein